MLLTTKSTTPPLEWWGLVSGSVPLHEAGSSTLVGSHELPLLVPWSGSGPEVVLPRFLLPQVLRRFGTLFSSEKRLVYSRKEKIMKSRIRDNILTVSSN